MASNIAAQLPQTPDNPWVDAQFPFDGAWMPNDDPSLIGPRNFAILTNMRYKEKTIWGINGYTKFNTTPLAVYTNVKNGLNFRSDKTEKSFTLVHAVDNGGQGRVYQNKSTPGTQGDFDSTARFTTAGDAYHTDRSSSLTGRFSTAPQNSMIYANGEETMIYSGTEQRCAAAFLELAAGISDVSDIVNVKLNSTYCVMSNVRKPIILTTRPIQGVKFYVETANVLGATLTAEYWSGSAWVAVDSMTDETIVTAKTMGQTGWVTFTHTESTAKPKHYQELYLYAYRFTMSAGTANIYYITVDPAFQSVKDIWDGVFRQPIQFQVYNLAKTAYEDYTLQVNQSSDINVPIGAQLDGLVGNANPASADAIFIMFEEKMAGIRMTMLGALLNAVSSTMTVYYWNGAAWTDVGATDGTAVGAITLAKTGTISWTPPATEEKTTLFGSLGFAYKIQFSATLTGTKASTAEVLIDLCTGIPAQNAVQPFDFACQFKNRVMLGGFTAGGEGNRMDFSIPNAPDVWNGQESSSNGTNSIYFGGVEPITTAVQLYNRFGASVFAMLLVFKDMEVYLLVGDSPEDFIVYPVSMVVGCPAPQTLAVTEINMEGGENFTRNFAVWLSHSGPMIFDGAVIAPLKGIENYFDPNHSDYINWDAIKTARGWVDLTYKEYNLLIPNGGNTTPNIWLGYDLTRRKWYKKSTGASSMPVSGWNAMDPATGEQFVYGGLSNGYVMRLEDGPSWNGAAMEYNIKCGDFWPSNNIWDYTTLRKYKLVCKKLNTDDNVTVNMFYFNNTDFNSGQSLYFNDELLEFKDTLGLIWAEAVSVSFDLKVSAANQRVIQKTIDLNYRGWAHAFELRSSTELTPQGFQPIAWGIRYRVERKDDVSNINDQDV
jgi:hypothetical protein